MDNFIVEYKNALTDEFCDNAVQDMDLLIQRAIDYPEFKTHVKHDDTNARKDISIFPIHFESLNYIIKGIEESLKKHYDMYAYKYYLEGTSFEDAFINPPKLQKSSSGGGFTQWHHEQGKGSSSSRFLVWMFYLNNVEKGGKTEFLYQDLAFKPTKGSLLIWPAAFTHTHRAANDLKEDKYIATGWFHYPKNKKVPENSFNS
jgi:hypothetical protein